MPNRCRSAFPAPTERCPSVSAADLLSMGAISIVVSSPCRCSVAAIGNGHARDLFPSVPLHPPTLLEWIIYAVNLFRSRDPRPFVHLHPRDELVAAIARSEDRGFAFPDVEPVLSERRNDIRLMRDEDRDRVGRRRCPDHLSESLSSSVVFIRRHDEPALRQICCLFDVLETGDDGRLIGAVVLAGVDFAGGNGGLTNGVAECFCQSLAIVA